MNTLNFKILEQERVDDCPYCGNPIFKTPPIGWRESIKQEYIFLGGDTIGGVWQRLTDKQKKPMLLGIFVIQVVVFHVVNLILA